MAGSRFNKESFSKGLAGKVPGALLEQLVYLAVNYVATQGVLPR